MKIKLTTFMILVLSLSFTSCQKENVIEGLEPPLQETGDIYTPIDGCQDLRNRGGTC